MSGLLFCTDRPSGLDEESLAGHFEGPGRSLAASYLGDQCCVTIRHHGVYAPTPIFHEERSGVGIAIDGWAAIGRRPAADLLRWSIEQYRERGISFVKDLNGAFNLLLWDDQDSRIYFANDRYGLRPVYRTRVSGVDYIGTSIRALLGLAGQSPRLNTFSLYNSLSFSRVWAGSHTLFRDVAAIEPGSILSWHDGTVDQSTYWDYEFTPNDDFDESDVDALAEAFRSAIETHLPQSKTTGLSLSGGLDSRAVLAGVAPDRRGSIPCYTWASSDQCSEAVLARETAEALQSPWEFLSLDPMSFLDRAQEGVRSLEGTDLCVQCYGLDVYEKIAAQSEALMTGLAFDVLCGGSYSSPYASPEHTSETAMSHLLQRLRYFRDPVSEMFCRPADAAEQLQQVELSLREDLTRYSDNRPADMVDAFIMRQRAWRVLFPRQRWQRMFMEDVVPTFDNDLIDLTLRIPSDRRASHHTYRMLLKKLDPVTHQIPYQGTMLPPSVPTRFWARAGEIESMRESLLREIYRSTNGDVYVPYTRYYSNFDEWLRVDDRFRDFFRDHLFGPDARLSDNYVDRQWMQSIFDRQVSGEQANYSRLIILLTMELALREHF